MYAASGVGLAAPQVGVRKRVIVVDVGENPIALVNPTIATTEGEQVGLEGCLSVPDLVGEVRRAEWVVVNGCNLQGQPITVEGEGGPAGPRIAARGRSSGRRPIRRSPHRPHAPVERERVECSGRERGRPHLTREQQSDMATDFDRFVDELQQQIIEQARAVYSDKVVEAFYHPRNLGRMPEPDACGVVHGWCGDTMEIYLRLNGERIEQASFMTDGCGPTVACGSKLTTMVCGMSLEEAGGTRPEDLLDALGGLPEESVHCAELAVNTLLEAIASRSQVEGQ